LVGLVISSIKSEPLKVMWGNIMFEFSARELRIRINIACIKRVKHLRIP